MLTRLIAAHPRAHPALVSVLAEHQLTALDPATTRALLSRGDLPASAERHIVDAIARTVRPTLERAGADITPAQVLQRAAPGRDVAGWYTILASVPAPDAALMKAAVTSDLPTTAQSSPVMCAIAAMTHLPLEVRAAALTRASYSRPLTVCELGPLATIAGDLTAEHSTPRLAGATPADITLLRAASSPYPANERSTDIAARLLAAAHARGGDDFLTARCVLLRSGRRAPDVARAALCTNSDLDLLDAIAVTPTVDANLRRHALEVRWTQHGPTNSERVADHVTDIISTAAPGPALDLLLATGRLPAALNSAHLSHAQVRAVFEALGGRRARAAFAETALPAVYVSLALLPTASPEFRDLARAALAELPEGDSRARAVAVLDAADARRPGDLPVLCAADLTDQTPGLRLVLGRSLTEFLHEVDTSDKARALLLVLPTFTGTLDDLFAIAAAIAA